VPPILVDTSAWIEFLRGTGSETHQRVRRLIEEEATLATTDVVLMELLAGARDDGHRDGLKRLLRRCEFLPIAGPVDYEDAAEVYRTCRKAGVTVRRLTDCLIAAVAIRHGAPILHRDADFDAIARRLPLEVV
jgi:predicted nucleic acid-binding protein